MAAGIGVDIVDIERIERLVKRYGQSFVHRVFTEAEAEYCGRMARPEVHYAGRFAVKEAFYKALPPECQPLGRWRGIETLSDSSGRPRVNVVDPGLARALEKASIGGIRVSISHERHFCVAMIVLDMGGVVY